MAGGQAAVPPPIQRLSRLSRDRRPFSYTSGAQHLPSKPSKAPRPRSSLSCPRVLPLLPEDEPPMIVHRQYNSPLPIYSQEAAAEQYHQQMGGAPDQHGGFDPRRSATLQLLHEQEQSERQPPNFFEKVAAAEAPKLPYTPEPAWTETARERQRRTRSQTPKGFSSGDEYSTQSLPRYTTTQQNVHHRPSANAPMRGYEMGGLDFTGLNRATDDFNYDYSGGQYLNQHQRRAKSNSPTRPGYAFGGVDYGTSARHHARYGEGYQGYGPLPPRKRPAFHGSRHDQLNTFESPNFDRVSDLRLIGDTVSNQKLSKDTALTSEQKKYIGGTFFTGPTGFKREHRTVRPVRAPPEPVTFSISAPPLNASAQPPPQRPFSTQPNQPNTGYQWAEQPKPVNMTTLLTDEALIPPRNRPTTPPWARQRESRRGQMPWFGSRSENAPGWSRRAEQTHTAWQAEADRLRGGGAPQAWPQAIALPASSNQQQQQQQDHLRGGGAPQAWPQAIALPASSNQQQQNNWQQSSSWSSSRHEKSSQREQQTRTVTQPVQSNWSTSSRREERNYRREITEPSRTTTATTSSRALDTQPVSFENFDQQAEMAETLPRGSLSNTVANTSGSYLDEQGRNVSYKREVLTSADPGKDVQLLKEEERRVIEQPLEPGVISRHVTTKYYKKKTVTDTTTTTTNATQK